MGKIMIRYLIFLACSVQIGCDPISSLTIHNYSDHVIYCYITCDDSIAIKYRMDLFITFRKNDFDEITSPEYRICAYSYKDQTKIGSWEEMVKNCADRTLKFFFITEDSMKEHTWEEIVRDQLFVRKHVYTLDELKALNWVVRYEK